MHGRAVTRQFLRIFDGKSSSRVTRCRNFCGAPAWRPRNSSNAAGALKKQKVFHAVSPLDLPNHGYGRHRRNMTSDYDQAMFLIGACFEGSGINAAERSRTKTSAHTPR